MRIIALWLALAGLGCALPKVALGGRVSLGRASAAGAASRATMRSALWVAIVYAASDAPEAPRELDRRAAPLFAERAPESCAIDIACAWEREAAYAAWVEEGAPSP
jgi:hypothetical protein